jgi:hypothetical protein
MKYDNNIKYSLFFIRKKNAYDLQHIMILSSLKGYRKQSKAKGKNTNAKRT